MTGWTTINTGSGNLVKLGEKEGQVRECTGVLKGVRAGLHGTLFDFEGEGGTEFSVPHNKALDELDPEANLGKLVQLEYRGTKEIKGGKTYKDIRVAVFNGPITPELAAKYPSLEVTVAEEDDAEALPF